MLPERAALFYFALNMYFYKIIRRFLGCIALFFACCSQSAAQDMSRVKATMDSLTSPRMHGRGYVNYGDRHAAAYISKEFKKLGLQQFNDTYFQFFTLDVNTFPDRVALQVNKKLLETGEEIIAHPASGAGERKARVFFVDSALVAKQLSPGLLKAGFRKKAVVFDSPKTRKAAFEDKLFFQLLPTASAIITLQEKLTGSLAPSQMPFVSLDVLETAWPAKAKKVRFAVDAEVQKNLISQNVIGYIEGKSEPDSVIIICAHYDHLGRMGRDDYFPGANDNASGVSMMLELANFYALAPNQPHYTMLFIAFSAEEAGLIGSDFYTQHPLLPLAKTKFLINLDLMGTGEEGMMAVNGRVFEKEFAMLEEINNTEKLLPQLKKRGEAANSDHYHFTSKGVRGFFFYTMGGTSAYHDVYDTPGQLSLAKFPQVFRLITMFVDKLAAQK